MKICEAKTVSSKLGSCQKYSSVGTYNLSHQAWASEVGESTQRYKGIENWSDDKVDWLLTTHSASIYCACMMCPGLWLDPRNTAMTMKFSCRAWFIWYLVTFVSRKGRTHPLRCPGNSLKYEAGSRLWMKCQIPQTWNCTGHILWPWADTPESSPRSR